MSLLHEAMESCILYEKTRVSDGYGGWITEWTEGVEFQAAITLDSSMQARIGEAQGVKALYTVTTRRAVNLQYHDVFQREADKKVFRVTSDGDDKLTPLSAGLDMRQVTAEEWRLASDESVTEDSKG